MGALGLHFLLSFELDRRQHTAPGVLTLRVVEHAMPCFLSCSVSPAPYPLTLEEIAEALGHDIIMAVSATVH
jgi:hypothetical protein